MKQMKHNKKRNVGLMYEMLLQHISSCLVSGNRKGASAATKSLEKRFSKGSELYKEFRLFNALAQSTISETHIVASILTEAKHAARRTNLGALEKEKSALIRDINYSIDDKDFYYQRIRNYKDLATIQVMINEWRKEEPDIKVLIEFEKKVGEQLLSEKKIVDIFNESENLKASDSDMLVMKIMTEKINKKYADLSDDEREIIKNYVFYSQQDTNHLKKYLSEKKDVAINMLENFEEKETNKILLEKVDSVREVISSLDINDINDDSVVKFLTITKLISELGETGETNV